MLLSERGNEIMSEITYRQEGDYLILEIALPKTKNLPQGKYSRMRLNYLKEHKKWLYTDLMLDCKLEDHLGEIEMAAQSRVKQIIEKLAKDNGVNEEMKANNQMEWVGMMNSFKAQAEEIVMQELIYS